MAFTKKEEHWAIAFALLAFALWWYFAWKPNITTQQNDDTSGYDGTEGGGDSIVDWWGAYVGS